MLATSIESHETMWKMPSAVISLQRTLLYFMTPKLFNSRYMIRKNPSRKVKWGGRWERNMNITYSIEITVTFAFRRWKRPRWISDYGGDFTLSQLWCRCCKLSNIYQRCSHQSHREQIMRNADFQIFCKQNWQPHCIVAVFMKREGLQDKCSSQVL